MLNAIVRTDVEKVKAILAAIENLKGKLPLASQSSKFC